MRTRALLQIGVVAIPLLTIYIIRGQYSHTAPPKIIVSKETTRILGPLTADGHIDYVAAANQLASQGVTPENNAVVLLWQALGPGDISPQIRGPYFKMLGVPPPAAPSGNFLQGLTAVVGTAPTPPNPPDGTDQTPGPGSPPAPVTIDQQLEQAIERPWSAAEFPRLAAWFAANQNSIKLLVDCSQRPRHYSPLLSGGNRQTMIAVLLPAAEHSREVARVFVGRAMLHVAKGELDEALQDSLACHRLGRLIGQGPTLVDALVAVTIDGMATQLDARIAESKALMAWQAQEFPTALKKLPPLPNVADKIDTFERLSFLDAVTSIEDGRAKDTVADLGGFFRLSAKFDLLAGDKNIDLNEALRRGNFWFDRMAQAARQPTGRNRQQARQQFQNAVHAMADALKRTVPYLDELTDEELSAWAGDSLVAMFVPASAAAVTAADRVAERNELIQLAFALAAYRLDKQTFPPELSVLAPHWIAEVPKDMFSERDLHYSRTDRGYLLYSVGPNGVDDSGRDVDADPPGDDISIQMPLQPADSKPAGARADPVAK